MYFCSNLEGIVNDELAQIPILFMDTAGCHMAELETQDRMSKGNEGLLCTCDG